MIKEALKTCEKQEFMEKPEKERAGVKICFI